MPGFDPPHHDVSASKWILVPIAGLSLPRSWVHNQAMATRAEPRDHRPRRAAAALVFVVVVFVIAPIFAMLATAY